nr:MAG TPA: hypothetical protein [Caudoviricetes sp.]
MDWMCFVGGDTSKQGKTRGIKENQEEPREIKVKPREIKVSRGKTR